MIVASSTPENPLTLTVKLLDEAPVGARILFSLDGPADAVSGYVLVEPDGWWAIDRPDGSYRHLLASWHFVPFTAANVVGSWRSALKSYPGWSWWLTAPGLVRVTHAVDQVLGEHWGWACRGCEDGLAYLPSAAVAGDDARAHVINHAELAGAR